MGKKSRFGNARKLPSGRWQARYLKNGDWHRAPKTFHSQREALDWLDDQNTDRRRGAWINPQHGRTLFRVVAGNWADHRVGIRESTRQRDRGYLDWYALPAFGDVPIGEIDYTLLTKWVSELSQKRAPATVNKALRLVSKVLDSAVSAELIPSNPATGVTKTKIERQEMRFLSVDQVNALATAIEPRYRSFVYTAAYGGLRASELFGLKWERVDLDSGRIWVTENLVEVGGRLYTEACKTKASVRAVTLPKVAQKELQGALRGNQEYVWEAPNGGPVRIGTFRPRVWKPACKQAGLEGLRIHDLRHTCAALLIESGAQPLDVSRRLGHTSVRFTLDTYGHRFPAAEDRLTENLDRLAEGTSVTEPPHPAEN